MTLGRVQNKVIKPVTGDGNNDHRIIMISMKKRIFKILTKTLLKYV